MDYNGSADPSAIQFELEEGYKPVRGIAIIVAENVDGQVIFDIPWGQISPSERIGLLQVVLDQYRYTYIDKSITHDQLFESD
jgi:hypothetical protein